MSGAGGSRLGRLVFALPCPALRGRRAYARVATPVQNNRRVQGVEVSFPQVWKKLWKTKGFCYLRPENTVVSSVPERRKSEKPSGSRLLEGDLSRSLVT